MKKIEKGDHVAIVVKVVEPEADYAGMIVSPMNVFEGETQPVDEEFYIMGGRILGKVDFTKERGWDFAES